MVRRCSHHAIFEDVVWGETEDAHGLHADVLVGRRVHYSGIGLVGDGAGQDVDRAAAGVSDAYQWEFNLLEGAVVIEGEPGELAGAEFIVDVDAGVDFLAAVAVGLEAVAGFEELNLRGVFRFGRSGGFLAGSLGLLLRRLLRVRKRSNGSKETRNCESAQERMESQMKSQDGLAGSLGRRRRCVKTWLRERCRVCTARQMRTIVNRGEIRITRRRKVRREARRNSGGSVSD